MKIALAKLVGGSTRAEGFRLGNLTRHKKDSLSVDGCILRDLPLATTDQSFLP
mgnify:CR=1 FL=1